MASKFFSPMELSSWSWSAVLQVSGDGRRGSGWIGSGGDASAMPAYKAEKDKGPYFCTFMSEALYACQRRLRFRRAFTPTRITGKLERWDCDCCVYFCHCASMLSEDGCGANMQC